MNNECGFTCRACGQFRPGPEGAHSESACLRVQLAALKAELAKYTGPLTDEQCVTLADRLKESVCVIGYFDAAIRAAREGAL